MSEQGVIKWYNKDKGYGFIAREGGKDVFLHASAFTGDPNVLDQGVHVQFDVKESPKGQEAVNVRTV